MDSAARDVPAPVLRRYDIHFLVNDRRFFWRNPNCGIAIIDAGMDSALEWHDDVVAMRRRWTDIIAVSLTSASDGSDAVNQCRIAFRDGSTLTATDANASGTVDHDRTPLYRDFVNALHRRLATAPEGTIRFTAGLSEGRHTALTIAIFLAILLFVGTPFVLLFIVRDWRVLGTLAAGAAFIWPFWKMLENNRPRRYDPRHPPTELME